MFILDRLIFSPLQTVLRVAQVVEEAVNQSREHARQDAAQQLTTLYRSWEAGEISDEEFDVAEDRLIRRLEGSMT